MAMMLVARLFATIQIYYVSSSADEELPEITFIITNNLHKDLHIPKDFVYGFHINAHNVFPEHLPARTEIRCRTHEEPGFQRLPGPDPMQPTAVFRSLHFRFDEEKDQIYVEYQTMYWNHQESDWEEHGSCLMSSVRQYWSPTMTATSSVSDCSKVEQGRHFKTYVFITIDARADKTDENQFLTPALPIFKSIEFMNVKFINSWPNQISIIQAGHNHCVDPHGFKTKTYIQPNEEKVISAMHKCGWAVDKPTTFYIYINDGEGEMHGKWAVAMVKVETYEDRHGKLKRSCSISSGITTYLDGVNELAFNSRALHCGSDTYYQDFFDVVVFKT